MKRRKFLGVMGGAAAAGPSVAGKTLESLVVPTMSGSNQGSAGILTGGQLGVATNDGMGVVAHAKQMIKHISGVSAEERQERIRNTYVPMLDPNAAALRSVNIQTKTNMTRISLYEKNSQRELAHWLRVIKGGNLA